MTDRQYAEADPQAYSDALDRLSQMATGNDAINTHPGLMNALASGNATPVQAGEINQFVSGVKAQNMFQLAHATGGKINFTQDERSAMDAMGFNYSSVDALSMTNQQATIDSLKQKGLVPTVNPDGTLATDSQGNIITRATPVAAPAPAHHGSPWGIGRIFHDVTHNPVTNLVGEGYNVAQAEVGQVATGVQHQWDDLFGQGISVGGNGPQLRDQGSTQQEMDAQRKIEMQAMGYDPNSVWSGLAFDAKGYAKTDLAPAIKEWDASPSKDLFGKSGMDMLPDVLQFLKNPKAYQDTIIADTSLTPDQASQKLAMINNPDFVKYASRVASSQLTVGNVGAQHQGLDPVNDARLYHLSAASADLVASFLIDPTIIGGKAVMAVRKAPTAIDGMYDVEGIVKQLDPAVAGPMSARRRIQNGWQSMIDSTNDIRDGLQVGDKAKVAGAYASIRAKTPELEPLIGDFLGTAQAQWRTTAEGVSGLSDHIFMNGVGEPVTNLAEAVNYVKDKAGLIRLAGGKAAVESSYMPGALSSYGYRTLKGNFASHLAERDVARTASQDAEYLAARNAGTLSSADQAVTDAAMTRADPAVPTRTIDLSKITKFLPTAIDGIDVKSGLVVSAPDAQFIGQHIDAVKDALAGVKTARSTAVKSADAEGVMGEQEFGQLESARTNLNQTRQDLASAIRAADLRAPKSGDFSDALLSAEKGQVAFNVRRYGSATAPEDGGIGGWASPTAVAARGRLAITRWSTLLPRNTEFDLGDAATSDKVYKYARFYLGKGVASDLAAQFANGDYAARKAIVEGLWDQVSHAAGMSRHSAGRELMDNVRTMQQSYTHAGPGWIVDGQPVALHEGQTTDVLHLPAFKTVHNAAANVGAYEATFGRLATSAPVDFMANMFRFGILAAPKTAYRNIIEPYLKAALDGQFGDVQRTHALTYMSSDELAKLGKSLGVDSLKGEVPDNVIQMARQHLQDTIANGTKHEQAIAKFTLQRVEKGDLAMMAGFGRTRTGSAVADIGARIAGYYRHALASTIPEQELQHADELYEVIPNMALHFGQQIVAEASDPYGAKAVRDISEAGLSPRSLNYNLASGSHPLLEGHGEGGTNTVYHRTGFSPQSTDRTVGTSRYINALAQRTHDAPDVAKAVMGVLRDPEGDLKPVIEALDARKGPRLTAYGKYFKPTDGDGQAIRALTPDEVSLGKKQWAQDVVNDYKYLLTSESGKLNNTITDYIAEHGSAPDEVWFNENVKHNEIPRSVLAPEYTATPLGGIHNLATVLNDLSGKAFNQIVEGPIKRQSSMPFLASHYLKARAEQDASGILDKMVDHGLSRDTADELLKGQAIRQAYIRTEQMIDDPGLKTQFDIVARNLLMFPRAMQAFVRRWGGSLQRDPFKARRMMLSLEATEHSGLVYRDQNGELTFTYPGSQVMRDAMAELGKLPGFEGIAKFPIGMDMTGKVMLAAPGFDQPFRFSLSPMINIPMRGLFSLMPEHQSLWTEIDTALNGQIGQGRGALQSVEPSAFSKIVAAMSTDERNSQFASAVKNALAHLYAAGYAPSPSAPPEEQDKFVQMVKTQVRNQLYLRAAFGLFAPAPPSSLEENIDQAAAKNGGTGTHSDYSFNLLGIKNLSDEYKHILDASGGDVARATQIFTYLHPEGLAYTVATTGTGVNKAYLPATKESLGWMEGHLDFLNQYKSVGAYFMPKAQGDFDINAYHAQLTLGLRQQKDIAGYYQDVQTMMGSNTYYQQYDQYQAMKAQAIASGDPQRAKVLATAFQDWKTQFLNQNLFLKGKFAESTNGKIKADAQIQDLQSMVDKGKVPDGLGPQLGDMLKIWRDYSDWKTQQSGSSTTNTATRQAAQDWVSQKLSGIAQQDPRLLNIYNAVFRGIDTSLAKVG